MLCIHVYDGDDIALYSYRSLNSLDHNVEKDRDHDTWDRQIPPHKLR